MKLTERKLYDMAQHWPDFQAFVAATDQIAGREIVANAFKYMFSPLGRTTVRIKKDRVRELVDTFTMAMLREGYKAIVNKNSIDDLFARASRGELRQALLNRGNQHFPWLGVTETTQDQDIDIAVD
ncbi:MAG: hypothetical protein AAFV19_15275 [Pseudomonadota bacterium]